jgi:formylglycine-generating enzyme required for sulfatase activity
MKMQLVRWFSIVLVYSFLLPAASLAQTPQEDLVQTHIIYLAMVRKVPPQDMAFVPAGEFMMGCLEAPGNCDPDNVYKRLVYLNDYFIDIHEVTNGQYAKCVAGGGCTPPSSNASNTHASYYDNLAFINYPVLYAAWEDAKNYCLWAGKRLPTEAEWEKAARGTIDMRLYPWGDQHPDCTMANGFNVWTWEYCTDDTTQVGSYPLGASPYDVLDMSGNIAEWVNDWYQIDYYANSPNTNPPGPLTGTEKILRGGGWSTPFSTLQLSDRWPQNPDVKYNWAGFRCAFSPGG